MDTVFGREAAINTVCNYLKEISWNFESFPYQRGKIFNFQVSDDTPPINNERWRVSVRLRIGNNINYNLLEFFT